jgi:hypothetical protein
MLGKAALVDRSSHQGQVAGLELASQLVGAPCRNAEGVDDRLAPLDVGIDDDKLVEGQHRQEVAGGPPADRARSDDDGAHYELANEQLALGCDFDRWS